MKSNAADSIGKATLLVLIGTLVPGFSALALTAGDPLLQKLGDELQANKTPNSQITERLGQYLEKNPTDYKAHLLMGRCYDRLGLYDQALAELSLAKQYSHDDPVPICELIKLQMTLGRNKPIPALLVEAQTKFPDDPQVYYLRGNWMLYGTHDLIRAQRLFAVAAGLRPNIPGLHLAMAEVAMQNKDYGVAVRQCNQELKIDPGAKAVLMTKGLALARAHQFSAALAPLKTVYDQTEYKLRPDLARSYAQVAYWNGKYQDAIEPSMLQLGITCNEANGDEDTLMKKILTDSLRHVPRDVASGTVATISSQMEKNPAIFKNGSYHRSVGDALREIGLHRLAVDEYQNCLKHDPNDGRALLGLAREFETTFADYKFALALYERVRTVSPEIPRIDSSIARLEERIAERDQDLAWRLKDWLRRASTEFGALFGGSSGEKPKPELTPQASTEKQ